MTPITPYIQTAFAKGGPVEQVMGAHRPEQEEAATGLATFFDAKRKPLYFREIGVGVGKTLAELVILGLNALLNGERAVIATNTTALRADLMNAVPAVDAIIARTLHAHGQDSWVYPLRVAERKSIYDFASAVQRDHLTALAANMPSAEQSEIKIYETWFDAALAANNGAAPAFASYYEAHGYDLPAKIPIGSLCLRPADAKNKTFMAPILTNRGAVDDADIIVMTHQMLVRTTALAPTWFDEQEIRRVVLDEADTLTGVCRSFHEHVVSHDDIHAMLIGCHPFHPTTAAPALIALADLKAWIKTTLANKTTLLLDHSAVINPFIQRVATLRMALSALHDEVRPGNDIITEETISVLRHELAYMEFNGVGTMRQAQYAANQADSIASVKETPQGDLHFGVKGKWYTNALRMLWARNASTVVSVAFISGTLTDPSRSLIYQSLGARTNEVEEGGRAIHLVAPKTGRIKNLVVTEFDGLDGNGRANPKSVVPILNVAPDVFVINPLYVDHVASGIIEAFRRVEEEEHRMLFLFCSQDMLDKTEAVIRRMNQHVHSHLIVQNSGVKAAALMPDYIAKSRAIWLGMNWNGINLVANGKTLPKTIGITKAPYSPKDDAMQMMKGPGEFFETRNTAYQKFRQGIGRAMRRADDRFDLWLFDCRIPPPPGLPKVASSRSKSMHVFTKVVEDLTGFTLPPTYKLKGGQLQRVV